MFTLIQYAKLEWDMELQISQGWRFSLMLILLVGNSILSGCYDPLDPNGNIAITFDIFKYTDDGYVARVTIQNFYQYRSVGKPGWKLGWTWAKDEVMWSISGAFATQQGDCSAFKYQQPHCCKKTPSIADLMPEGAPQNRSADCCHGGVLAARAIKPLESYSSFEVRVGNLDKNTTEGKPLNLTLLAPGPGYTCGPVEDTDPTVSSVIGGMREEQVFRTWKSTCTYSSYIANKTPVCCASLSTFYSPTISSCPRCTCGCRPAGQKNATTCVREDETLSQSNSLANPDIVRCTNHMCPLRVHWHVKNNYRDYWRVKLTISNYNYNRSYSDWNVLIQHPGFSKPALTYSFNSTLLPTAGIPDDVGLFWGLDHYNSDILTADETQVGSVTTDIILEKDIKSFTLSNGWAFPRKIYINGENCEMALPDTFPMLPNGSSKQVAASNGYFIFLSIFYLILNVIIAV
ncbi:COBRA-like protein 1 [Heracleum sosnowskyi]|uniref:COBRA-like protein n=1 Tax=Heracleum sosnowskyi TaxID=360622 RepID=A0AAD8JGK3_9APIA|nr:COBRA-like protein 1 [Heracleum sosnowskyi]